jgi:flagellar basal-body rod protein FlgF
MGSAGPPLRRRAWRGPHQQLSPVSASGRKKEKILFRQKDQGNPPDPRNSAENQNRMTRGVYAAAAGMMASEQWLDQIANNLANASTTGFKRDEATFNEGYLRLVRDGAGRGAPLGELGAGPDLIASRTVWEQGSILHTGSPLEAAIRNPRGLFAVETPAGVRYTRAGSFTLNDRKELVTHSGLRVLDDRGQPLVFPPDTASPKIMEDGRVMAGEVPIGRLALWDGDAVKVGGSLFTLAQPQQLPAVSLAVGAIEASNVNPVEEMISMIKLHRAFEMSQKSASSQDEATSGLIQAMNRS